MSKSILGGLLALGLGALCEKPKPPNPFANAAIQLKAENSLCGAIGSITEESGYLILNDVLLDKNEIARIFSGGFIVKPAQRIGMEIEINRNGVVEKLTNVWVEEMTPYEEQREAVLIKQMAVRVENTDEQPEEPNQKMMGVNEIYIRMYCNAEYIGTIQSADIEIRDDQTAFLKFSRVLFDAKRCDVLFRNRNININSQMNPAQIEVFANRALVAKLTNVWFTNIKDWYQNEKCFIVDGAHAECEKVWFK